MVKKYQETANFVSGVLDVTELQNISPFISRKSSPYSGCWCSVMLTTSCL